MGCPASLRRAVRIGKGARRVPKRSGRSTATTSSPMRLPSVFFMSLQIKFDQNAIFFLKLICGRFSTNNTTKTEALLHNLQAYKYVVHPPVLLPGDIEILVPDAEDDLDSGNFTDWLNFICAWILHQYSSYYTVEATYLISGKHARTSLRSQSHYAVTLHVGKVTPSGAMYARARTSTWVSVKLRFQFQFQSVILRSED